MATDNRTEHVLFPDVTEHYEPVPGPGGDVYFPVPHENYPREPISEPAGTERPSERIVLAVQLEPETRQNVVDEAPVTALKDGPVVVEFLDTPDRPAHAPDWVRAHLPRHPLAVPDNRCRGLGGALGRSPRRISVAAPVEGSAPTGRVPMEPASTNSGRRSSRGRRKPWLIAGVAVSVLSAALAATVSAVGGADGDTEAAAVPSAASTATAALAASSAWCAESSTDGRVVGRGAGDRATEPGVIQAFDHAYYVGRDGALVASMMLTPNPVPQIQTAIDAVPVGTEHCLTITPTDTAHVYGVELTLLLPSGSEVVIRQRITVSPTDTGVKIATVENLG